MSERDIPAPGGRAGMGIGFTLIEVLMALTILAMAGTIVYSSLGTAVTSWSTGLVRGRRAQVLRIAADRISQQLKSAVPAAVKKEGRWVAAFDGGGDSIRFVTLLPSGPQPLAQVSYSIEDDGGGRLVYREYAWPDKDFFEEREPRREEGVPEIAGMEVVLLEGEEESVFGDDRGEGEREEWIPGESAGLPGEVRVRFVAAGEEREAALEVTIPLRVRALRREPPEDRDR